MCIPQLGNESWTSSYKARKISMILGQHQGQVTWAGRIGYPEADLVDEEATVLGLPAIAPEIVSQLRVVYELIVHVIQVIEAALVVLIAASIVILAAGIACQIEGQLAGIPGQQVSRDVCRCELERRT